MALRCATVVHVLTTATIDRLRERLSRAALHKVRRFPPNIVVGVASGHRSFVENDSIGVRFAIEQLKASS
jgi:uncharacterized protein YcbX